MEKGMQLRNIGMTSSDWAAWARLCKRFPDIKNQVDDCAAIMAAQAGHINVRMHVQNGIGGWIAVVIGYSPALVNFKQSFRLNSDREYPNRFESLQDAVEAAIREAKNLRHALGQGE